MKIITLNLHLLQEKNQQQKLEKIADYINKFDVDLCFFQEVAQHFEEELVMDNIRKGNNAYIIFSRLKKKYYLYYEFKKRGYGVYEEGLAIVSKYPLYDKKWFYISKTKDLMDWMTRIIIRATLQIDDTLIDCYCVHMGWNQGQERYADQALELLREADKSKNKIIFAGDFNAGYKTPEYQIFTEHGFKPTVDYTAIDTKENPTFAFRLDSSVFAINRHIDFIFTNFKVQLLEYRIDFNQKRNYVSDHFLVYSEIKI